MLHQASAGPLMSAGNGHSLLLHTSRYLCKYHSHNCCNAKAILCHLRVQCEVSSGPSGRQACLLLTSMSKHNPTGVQLGIHRADHKRVVKLLNEGKWQQLACGTTDQLCSKLLLMTAGESTQLHVGDRILLLANQLGQFLEVAESAETSSTETAQSPPQKRCS